MSEVVILPIYLTEFIPQGMKEDRKSRNLCQADKNVDFFQTKTETFFDSRRVFFPIAILGLPGHIFSLAQI